MMFELHFDKADFKHLSEEAQLITENTKNSIPQLLLTKKTERNPNI